MGQEHNVPPERPPPANGVAFIGTACNRHILNDRTYFRTLRPVPVSVASAFVDGADTRSTGVGDAVVRLNGTRVTLKNATYLPTLPHCMLSVSCLCRDGATVASNGHRGCTISWVGRSEVVESRVDPNDPVWKVHIGGEGSDPEQDAGWEVGGEPEPVTRIGLAIVTEG